MKRSSIMLAILLLGLSGGQPLAVGAGDKDNLDRIEYYPLKVGTTWEYLVNGKKSVTKVAAHEMLGNLQFARLETTSDGSTITEHVTVKDGNVFRVVANGQELKPPWLLLKVPPKVGDKWGVDSQSLPIQGSFVVLEAKKLKVGDKEYDTVQITSSGMKYAGQDVELKTWFAKDVGMVKQTFLQPAAGLNITVELKEFTAGK